MSPPTLAIAVVTFISFLFILTLRRKQSRDGRNQRQQPPGPPALPIIGNLRLLGQLPHRDLQSLATRYGPIMSFRLGQVPAVIISSSEAAESLLKTNDVVFASRPRLQASDIVTYGSKGIVFCEYGPYWRNMRKLCTLHLLSASKVETFAPLRRDEVKAVVKSVEEAAAAREVVDVSQVVSELVENIGYKMILSCNKDEQLHLKGHINEGMRTTGAFNLADYVPWLGRFDLQGLKRAITKTSKALDVILEKIITEHEDAINSPSDRQDFIDIMLSLMHHNVDGQYYGIERTNIKAIVLDLIAGSSETSTAIILWALSALIKHPRVMKILQEEIETVVGRNMMVEETDLTKLHYLDMVIKETMRLYPAGSLLHRESTEDTVVDGYYMKKNTRILINLWAIGRDPKVWFNAEDFCPERFADKNVDYRGLDFEFIPFGSGRRGCPGIHLGLITVKFIVAQLVHCFSWELPWGQDPNDLDMSEKFGLSLPRAKNLCAVPTSRIKAN
ncbi:hypothetical protein QN277_012404 [Acacia crassicarpa]|uniref:Cytochrome P450 n=1 Tax=Acacia crassicarpa TaxID=499986 RepID=A0AAE1TEK6_9FABA|nr:hypothetical protein QN277_012404 [Acacia crassicarpa]